jgi:hypothetical protein
MRLRPFSLVAIFALVATLLSGSALSAGATSPSSWLPSCTGAAGADYLAVVTDSASERSRTIISQRESRLAQFAATAFACRGTLQVIFDPAQSQAQVLYSGTITVHAATEIAYQRLGGRQFDTEILPAIEDSLKRAESHPAPKDGTPVSAFEILAEDRSKGELNALVLSDMIETDPSVNLDQPLTAAQAQALAASVTVPRLPHAVITIAGVGATSDPTPAPDDCLGAVRTFAEAVCTKTGARCRTTTQIES